MMLRLYIEAPFAVCRTFTAGWYRPTVPFLTPTTVYGLLLNLAGIESRLREEDEGHDSNIGATLMRNDLPSLRVAVGVSAVTWKWGELRPIPVTERYPRVQTLYQQLHNYPVGEGNKVTDPDDPDKKISISTLGERRGKGNKFNIAPVRREILVGVRAIVAVEADAGLEERISTGVRQGPSSSRYGLPFLGDNSFLPDRIEILDQMAAAHWYETVTGEDSTIRSRTARMTTWIDRAELSRTRSRLFAPTEQESTEIPAGAWTTIPGPSEN
jgi:CRISPR-associated protein Cas5t